VALSAYHERDPPGGLPASPLGPSYADGTASPSSIVEGRGLPERPSIVLAIVTDPFSLREGVTDDRRLG
jgi:hypothetical protein